jgi:cohesin complex subunit SA-1/2
MVHTLPRLLTKYAPDAGRIAEVLQIPPLMNLQVYSELRMLKVEYLEQHVIYRILFNM